MKKKQKSHTLKIFFLLLIIILIVLRLLLPHFLLKYAINRINQIPEYHVTIADLDVNLWRGSYTLKTINLKKITNSLPVPFFSAATVDLSVQWAALFQGKIVAKIAAVKPVLNFVIDPQGKNEQLSINAQWEDAVKALFPLNFNRVEATQGEVNFRSYTAKPPFKLTLQDINFKIDNLHDSTNTLLPSTFYVSGNSQGGAKVIIKGKFNPYTKVPTFYTTADLKGMPISEAANLLKHYTAIDVKSGSFSLYVEAAAEKGKITGYAKPFFKDLQIAPSKASNPIEAIYDGALQVVSKIITNHQHDTIATKINLSGSVEDPDTSIFSIIGYLISHAFIEAIVPGIDHDVQMRDIYYGKRH